MWRPFALRHASRRFLKLFVTRSRIAGDIALTSLVMFRFSWSRVSGLPSYTRSLRHPHRKKSRGFISGDRGAHSTSHFLLIRRSLNTLRSQRSVAPAVWQVAPSCWNQICDTSTPRILKAALNRLRTDSVQRGSVRGKPHPDHFVALFQHARKSPT